MRQLLLIIPLLGYLAFSCNNPTNKTSSSHFNTDSLTKQLFSVDISKDTLLRTSGGMWLKIDKGTFNASTTTITLEVKEALNIKEIIKARLTTQTDGALLSSGGMFYINAPGQSVSINKPVRVAIPSDFLEEDMQLYKGKKDNAGKLNWQQSSTLGSNSQLNSIRHGEIIFQQKCASCHGIGKEGSGPDLANLFKRFGSNLEGEGAYLGYSHNFSKVYYPFTIEDYGTDSAIGHHQYDQGWTELYICNLISLYGKEVNLNDEFNKNWKEIKDVYDYIDNESNKKNLPLPPHAYLNKSVDSCSTYKKIKQELEEKKARTEQKRRSLIEDNGTLSERIPDPTWQRNTNIPPSDFTDKVKPVDYPAVYYQFTIETFGWYNIDMLLSKKENVQESQLSVRITGRYREKIKVYLIIPSEKVFGEGSVINESADEYAFYKTNKSIPLPQLTKAYILALTEIDAEQSIAFALKEFETSNEQNLEMQLQIASKKEFNTAIETIVAGSLEITIKDSKNFDNIRQTDNTIKQLNNQLKNVEKLKPIRCNCNCGAEQLPGAVIENKNQNDFIVPAPAAQL